MKLKWKLLPLAFAAAGFIGCTDEIEGPGNNGENSEMNGEKTYITVSVNSEMKTKANPTGGEEGDGPEAGSVEESDVKDVTIVLYKPGGDGNNDFSLAEDRQIAGVGYSSNEGILTGDVDNNHSWKAVITVQIEDAEESWDGQTYGVLAITNLGQNNDVIKEITKEDQPITTVGGLADIILKDNYGAFGTKGFVMSSHTIGGGITGLEENKVTLKAGATENNAPAVTVYVERLAAKVRINATAAAENPTTNGGHLGNFVYVPQEATSDRVILQDVVVVNQLTSGSYLLKRVADNTDTDTDVTYLGDEVVTSASTNYVIDPWTTGKKIETNTISYPTDLTYINQFQSFNGAWNYDKFWETVTGNDNTANYKNVPLYTSESNNIMTIDSDPKLLCYTMENTTSIAASINGFSTGALFKALYLPEKWMAIDATGKVDQVTIDYNSTEDNVQGPADAITEGHILKTGVTVPTYYVSDNGVIWENYETVLQYYIQNHTKTSTLDDGDLTYASFSKENIAKLSKEALEGSALADLKDPFGYIEYLLSLTDDDLNNGSFKDEHAFSSFYASSNANLDLFRTYTNGVCYYPFWIRHNNNNNDTEIGSMEFAIVRNNIYDMSVGGVKRLGLAGTDEPDPENPNETKEVYLTVNLFVKDWVVRSNSGIIL